MYCLVWTSPDRQGAKTAPFSFTSGRLCPPDGSITASQVLFLRAANFVKVATWDGVNAPQSIYTNRVSGSVSTHAIFAGLGEYIEVYVWRGRNVWKGVLSFTNPDRLYSPEFQPVEYDQLPAEFRCEALPRGDAMRDSRVMEGSQLCDDSSEWA
ncbi:MAG: hypothetical protein HYV34_03665 [Candidatus Kerfeldbacteria bacterium]|nr:hypothetical protein [Candidatus Kerfeldbacteria bacterium]